MTRRILNAILLVMLFVFSLSSIPTASGSEKNLIINGNTVKYRGTSINVKIPTEYVKPDADFRGVWVTPIVGGNLAKFSSIAQYKQEITQVLDIMEYYNLNALIFHVRPFNDALYRSELNPWSEYLVGFGVDPGWDPLPWIIEETHKRGIEFHAWLNPYRITNSNAVSPEAVANRYRYYPENAASNPENILVNGDKQRAILNPGEPAVREFLIDTVLELMENYDIDAIHFDDYFYINDIDDSHTRNKPGYNPKNLGTEAWRREQVDIFIHDLSQAMREFNLANNRYVQLGISPTGIYRNGGSGFAYGGADNYDANGNFITNGSNTAGQEHYRSYLFSDTKKWVDNEWIDYIIPQTYWAFTHPVAGYADVVDWWAKVVRYKNVNLYTGMGVYMSSSGGNYSWGTNVDEAIMQVLYNTKHEIVQGTSIFSYTELKYSYLEDLTGNTNRIRTKNGLEKLRTNYWNSPSIMPELRTYERVYLNKVTNLQAYNTENGAELSWNKINDASKYAIYRSSTQDFTNEDLIAVVGHEQDSQKVVFLDQEITLDTFYRVVPISRTNTLGEEAVVELSQHNKNEIGEIANVQIVTKVYPWEQFTLIFDKLPNVEGVSYHLEYTYDLKNFEVIDTQLVELGTKLGADLQFPYRKEQLFIKIVARNQDGTSSTIIDVTFKEEPELSSVNRIYIRTNAKAGRKAEFFWNLLEVDFYQNLEYVLEYSFNNKDFYEAKQDFIIDTNNRLIHSLYIPNQDKVYVRVKVVHPLTGKYSLGEVHEFKITKSTYFEYFNVVYMKHIKKTRDIIS